MTENTSTQTGNNTILITGGTGKTGRRVAERLEARGADVRIGSRRSDPPFDWHDPSTWTAALDGVGAAYIVFYPDLISPEAAPAIRAFSEQAVRSGVRRLVLLSGRGEEETEHSERAVRESGADWTIVKSSWFAQNFSEDFLLEPVRGGRLVVPAGQVPEAFIDADDIADVAAAALTEDGHSGQLYEVSGPRLLTFGDVAEELTRATGREVQYVSGTPEESATELAKHLPAEYVPLFVDLFTRVLDGRNASLADGVQRALGREPRDFADYAREAAATGVWSTAGEGA